MMKKGHFLFCAATLVVAAAHLTSCTQDDENYANDMYTMAEKLETRTPEPGGGELPSYTKSADMKYVSFYFKKLGDTNIYLWILATNDMSTFGAYGVAEAANLSFRTAEVTKTSEDSLNYFFKVKVRIEDQRFNKYNATKDISCPKSAFN